MNAEKLSLFRKALRLAVLAASVLLATYLVAQMTVVRMGKPGGSAWALSEWFINYQGGFVRRGLVGEALRTFAYGREVAAVNWLVFLLSTAYFALSGVFAAVAIRSTLAVTLLLAAPFSYLWMAFANEYYFRKEILFYIVILACALLFLRWKKTKNQVVRFLVVGTIILSAVVLPLVHEAYMFFCGVPLYAILSATIETSEKRSRAHSITSLYVGLSLLMFALMTLFKGDSLVSQMIWASLSDSAKASLNGDYQSGAGAIGAIGWTTREGVELSARVLASGLGAYYLFALVLTYLTCTCVFALSRRRPWIDVCLDRTTNAWFLVVVLAFLPLFVLGWDWGRWTAGCGTSFLVLLVLRVPAPFAASIAIDRGMAVVQRGGGAIALLLLTLLFTRVPECCLAASGATQVNFVTVVPMIVNKLLAYW